MENSKERRFKRVEDVTLTEVMERAVQFVHPGTKANVIASMMIEGFGSVPVVDEDRRLLGVVSEHDPLLAYARGHRWTDLTAGDVMTSHPYSIRTETRLDTLIHVMVASNLIRVPVVDRDERLVGIIARRDVLRACLSLEFC